MQLLGRVLFQNLVGIRHAVIEQFLDIGVRVCHHFFHRRHDNVRADRIIPGDRRFDHRVLHPVENLGVRIGGGTPRRIRFVRGNRIGFGALADGQITGGDCPLGRLRFLAEELDGQPRREFFFRRRLVHGNARAVEVQRRLATLRQQRNVPFEFAALGNGVLIERHAGRRREDEQDFAVTKARLLTIALGDRNIDRALVLEQALNHRQRVLPGLAVERVRLSIGREDGAAARKHLRGKVGRIVAECPAVFLGRRVGGFTHGFFPGLPIFRRFVVAEFRQPIGVIVHHFGGTLRGETQNFVLELRVLVRVDERLNVILQVIRAQAVFFALQERRQIDDCALRAIERGLVLVRHRHFRRLTGGDRRAHFGVDIGIRRAGDFGFRRDAVRIRSC